MRRWAAAIVTLAAAAALAQPIAADAPPRLPRIDPADALEGRALLEALRGGGFVLLMRHAQQGGRQTEECTGTNLTPHGVAQAKQVGAAIRALRIPIGAVHASQLCRAVETAHVLDVGGVERTADLNPSGEAPIVAARFKRLAQAPPAGTNALLVSHVQGGSEADRVYYELAEIIVYRPDASGSARPVARIRPEDWEALLALR